MYGAMKVNAIKKSRTLRPKSKKLYGSATFEIGKFHHSQSTKNIGVKKQGGFPIIAKKISKVNSFSRHNAISVEDRKSLRQVVSKQKEASGKKDKVNNSRLLNQSSMNKEILNKENRKIASLLDTISKKKDNIKVIRPLNGYLTKKNGDRFKCISSSLLVIKKKIPKENLLKRLILGREKNQALLNAIKYKMLKWLWVNKSFLLESFIVCYKDYKFFFDKKKVTRGVFEEFMQIIELPKDDIFVDNVFILFDHERKGVINYKEFLINVVMTSDTSNEQKLIYILNSLTYDNKFIYYNEIKEVLQFLFNKKEHKYILDNFKMYYFKYNDSSEAISSVLKYAIIHTFITDSPKILQLFQSKMIKFTDIDDNVEGELGVAYSENLKNAQSMLYSHSTREYNQKSYEHFEQMLFNLKHSAEIKKSAHSLLNKNSDEEESTNNNNNIQ